MKKIYISSIASLFLLVGCGGGSSNTSNIKEVKVIDAYVVGAKVCDIKGICAITDENGTARADFDLNNTLTSIGGFIDSNFNGIKDSDELDAPFMLAPAGASVITPLTTLVAKGADINKLSSLIGVSKEDILHKDPIQSKNVKLIKAINVLYPVLKEKRVDFLVKKINNYSTSNSLTDLPDFNNANVNIYSLVSSVLILPKDIEFVSKLSSLNSNSAEDLIKDIEELKKGKKIIKTNNIDTTTQQINQSSSINNQSINNQEVANEISNVNQQTQSNIKNSFNNNENNNNSIKHTSNSTDLPDFNAPPSVPTTTNLETTTDLPTFSDNVEMIPTNNTYNPSYTPLPKKYYIKLNSFNEFIEVKKDSNKKFEFKNPKYINIANSDFNATKMFDINATYVYNDLNFSPDGYLNGTIFINLKDLNSSNEVNFTIKNVQYKVVNSKLIQTILNSVNLEVNETNNSKIKNNINAGVYNKFDINLSKVIRDYNESEYNLTNHKYSFEIDYNISNKVLNLIGSYEVINAIPPQITLNDNSFLVSKNRDINLTVGKSNVANAKCYVENINLNCYVDNSKNIYLYGHTPNEEAIKVVDITLSNQDYNTSKSFYLEILKPADKVVVTNWNLSSSPYEGNHIKMTLTGNMPSIVDVNTSANIISGSPENNVTVYIQQDDNNYITFIFDANVYKSNDWFIVKRNDGKVAKFRVGDIDISNNVVQFK